MTKTFREIRLTAGHTQTKAAATIGAGSYRTVQDWESGQSRTPPYALMLYALLTDQHPALKVAKRKILTKAQNINTEQNR